MGAMHFFREAFQLARGGELEAQNKNLCLVRDGEVKGGGEGR